MAAGDGRFGRRGFLKGATAVTLGHNALLQQAARLGANVTDNYGRLRPKGSSVPLREDFNALDDPFFWSPETGFATANAPGMHFVAFLPASRLFHRARRAMDGVMPDGTNFREAPTPSPMRTTASTRGSGRRTARTT